MTSDQLTAMENVLGDVHEERRRQHARWGEQDPPRYRSTWEPMMTRMLATARHLQRAGNEGYSDVLLEEVAEAMLAPDDSALRAELVQVAAVAVQWIEALDRATGRAAASGHAPEGSGKGSAEIVAPAGAGCVGWDGDGREVGDA